MKRTRTLARAPAAAPATGTSSRRVVTIHNAHPRLKVDRRTVTAAIHLLDQNATDFRGGPPPGELSLAFLTDAALARLHQDFLADPTPTDVITFEGDPAFGTAGEICVSADTAQAFARAHGGEFPRELTLYLVHGWLHLAGYDDLVPARKRQMRAAEARAMRVLDAAGAWPVFGFRARAAARRQ